MSGLVRNTTGGAHIEIEGPAQAVTQFLEAMERHPPPRARMTSIRVSERPTLGRKGFHIQPSDAGDTRSALIPADIATCTECLADIAEPRNRRYRYPFTNCTACGPRFSIVEDLPYDRGNTTMRDFIMCSACQAEYDDPRDRRFHAQPNACPQCGPRLSYVGGTRAAAKDHEALVRAAELLRAGGILALKGLGGFHLMVDARDEAAVARLRRRKGREAKPLAIMAPNLAAAEELCSLSSAERHFLCSPEAPIVLLHRHPRASIAHAVAPGNPYLGVMLPYTPLHHLLLGQLNFPVVATSGNRSEEPMCFENEVALVALDGIADGFLLHDRPIARPVDDSIVQVVLDEAMVLRRSRGYVPLPIELPLPASRVLGYGGHLKATISFSLGRNAFISQHLGNLESAESLEAYQQTLGDLPRLYGQPPVRGVCDLHPDYASTRKAEAANDRLFKVQHHVAHVLSVMAEHQLTGPVLGVSWDGSGYGPDGTVWGGEFLAVSGTSYSRVAHLRPFSLPGGEAAVREPRRSALGMLFEVFGSQGLTMAGLPPLTSFEEMDLRVLGRALERGVNTPRTTSCGRLFDGLSSLLGLRQTARFEGEAAMNLEFALPEHEVPDAYPFQLEEEGSGLVLNWEPMLRTMLVDIEGSADRRLMAARIHNTMVAMIVAVVCRRPEDTLILSGGCFQNRYLLAHTVKALRDSGRRVFWNQSTPVNDGGISLGQVMAAALGQAESGAVAHGLVAQPDYVDGASLERRRPLTTVATESGGMPCA